MSIRQTRPTSVTTMGPKVLGLIFAILLPFAATLVVHGDRVGDNQQPAWEFHKKGKYYEAAMYYHRALRGLREIYIAFHWNGDPMRNASGTFTELYTKMPKEMEDRVNESIAKGNIGQSRWREIESLNDLWMGEMVDHDRGDMTTCCPILAPEAERHGDFTAAEVLRRGEARFYRAVAIPYHEKAASVCEKRGEEVAAVLHRKMIEAYERRAEVADRIARGNRMLMEIPGLEETDPVKFGFYPQRNLNPIPNEYIRRRWWGGESENERSNDDIYADRWKGKSPEEAAAILRAQGLKHGNEDARFSAVMVLANLGEKEAMLSGLSDSSPHVRLAAAQSLASMRWAQGWATCYEHADERVRAAVAPLFAKPQGDVRSHTFVVTTLIQGLNSKNSDTRLFCQSVLERITGKGFANMEAWSAWWEEIGGARPGLRRTGGGIPEGVDETIDFGTWWQTAIQHAPNPLKNSQPPGTFRWDGYVAVTQPGDYRFFVQNRGEGWDSRNATGRSSLGMFFPSPCVKLIVDGKNLIPSPKNEMLDPTGSVRMDFTNPIRLNQGLHKIDLEFEWRGGRTPGWWHGGQPVIRLYWSSQHFLRQLIATDHLICLEASNSSQ